MGTVLSKPLPPTRQRAVTLTPRLEVLRQHYVRRLRNDSTVDEAWARRHPTGEWRQLGNQKLILRHDDGRMVVAAIDEYLGGERKVVVYLRILQNGNVCFVRKTRPVDEVRMFYLGVLDAEREAYNRRVQVILRSAERAGDGNLFGRLGLDLCGRICSWVLRLSPELQWQARA